MRNRRGLNRIGMLAIALIIALGATGVTYGAWVDEIYIGGTLSTSNINASLDCGTRWEELNNIVTDVPDTSITCTGTGMTRNISVNNAQYNTNPALNTHYYCNFIVRNAVNSFPVKIQSVDLPNPYSGSGVTAVFDDLTNTVINPGQSATGKVHIYLTNNTQMNQNLTFVLTVVVN